MQVAKPKKGYKLVKTSFGKYEEIPEEWEVEMISKLTSKIENGYTYKENNLNSGLPISRIETISNGNIDAKKVGNVELSDKNLILKYKLQEGDILFSHINSTKHIGKTAIYENQLPLIIHGMNLLRLVVKNDQVIPKYFHFVLKYEPIRQLFRRLAKPAVNQASITTKELGQIYLPIPPLPEQKQISSILSNVDSALQNTNQIIEQTQRLKKGMTQKLLTRGIGHTKFKKVKWYFGKQIEIPEEWELRKLGDVCEFLDSERIPLKESDRSKMNGNIPYYGASGVIDYVNDYIFDEKLLCLGEDGENLRSRVKPLAFTIQGKSWVNNHAHVLRPNNLTIHEYLECYLNQISVIQHLDFSAQPKLNQTEMKKIKFTCPSISEQKQIAPILSNVDTQIQKEKLHKSNLERLKKGLMQKLLTGQIRVKV